MTFRLPPSFRRSAARSFLLGCIVATAPAQPLVPGRFVELNRTPPPPEGQVVAIVGARLVDGRGGPAVEDSAVVVRGSTIEAAGARRDVKLPAGAEVLDGAGMTLVPGLVDAHLHGMHLPRVAALFVGNGVTSA